MVVVLTILWSVRLCPKRCPTVVLRPHQIKPKQKKKHETKRKKNEPATTTTTDDDEGTCVIYWCRLCFLAGNHAMWIETACTHFPAKGPPFGAPSQTVPAIENISQVYTAHSGGRTVFWKETFSAHVLKVGLYFGFCHANISLKP